jgi:hypothetical protein
MMVVFMALSCAFDVVRVKQIPTQLEPVNAYQDQWILTKDIKVKLGTGYSRTLKAGTAWNLVGKTEYGDVYRTKDQILTVEGSNIYEAFIVVSDGYLVGFYLPAEQTFSPISSKKLLAIEK